jgi:hypothetical protein
LDIDDCSLRGNIPPAKGVGNFPVGECTQVGGRPTTQD